MLLARTQGSFPRGANLNTASWHFMITNTIDIKERSSNQNILSLSIHRCRLSQDAEENQCYLPVEGA
ncbi:hypothetical protein OAG60_01875 [bacterium]|nr:hypothetical protein [bacterium]